MAMPMTFRRGPLLVLAVLAVLADVSVRADDADDRFAVAAGHYARHRWKLAAEEFQAFLEKHPNHANADQSVFFLGEALLQSGNSERAGTHFRRYLDRVPSGKFARPALFRAAETAYLAGKTDLALAELKQFQSKYPDDKLGTYVLPYLGDIALGRGDAAAAGYFRAALSKFPRGRLVNDCRFGLARALEKQGKNKAEVERLYRSVASKTRHPLADDAQCRLGALQYAAGKYAQAIKTFATFETTLATSPWKSNARLGRGWALRKLGRLDEAKALFESITSDPKVGIEARYWLGVVQRAQEDWAAAAGSLLAAAAAAGPQHRLMPAIRFHAGDALLRSGDTAAACRQFDQVIASEVADNQWIDDALFGKVQAALLVKDYQALDRAAAKFDKQFPNSPLKANVHRKLAQSLLDRKQYEEALAVLLPVLDAADGRLKTDAQLTQGSLLLATGRYADAVRPLNAFLASKPAGDEAVRAWGELAICYARTGRLDKAKNIYAALLKNHPRHELILPTTEQLAEAAYEAKDTQWSAELFSRLGADAGSAESRWKGLSGLGWSRLKAGRLAEAAETFDELLKKNPPAEIAAETAMVRGRTLEQLDRSDQALTMYDLVIAEHPKSKQHPDALLAAAQLRDKLGQDQEAAALYERLAKEYPKLPELDAVLYQWAWALEELGKTDQSSGLFERVRKQYPQGRYWADATLRLAQRALVQAKDTARAGKLVSELLAGKPAPEIREAALNLRGQMAVDKEDWEQVGKAFATLVGEFPKSPRRLAAEYWIAESLCRQGDYEAANQRFEQLAGRIQGRGEPWLANVPMRRAQVLGHLKKWNEAYAIASKIKAQYPNFPQQYEADYLIGRCLANRADFQGARDAFQKVIRSPTGAKTETAAMAQWMIGETYFHQESYEAALREYLRLEILYAYPTWQSAALLQAGKCHEKLGEHREAAKLYNRVLKVYPKSPFVERARQRLKTTAGQRARSAKPD